MLGFQPWFGDGPSCPSSILFCGPGVFIVPSWLVPSWNVLSLLLIPLRVEDPGSFFSAPLSEALWGMLLQNSSLKTSLLLPAKEGIPSPWTQEPRGQKYEREV
jgi:hypothetical protein